MSLALYLQLSVDMYHKVPNQSIDQNVFDSDETSRKQDSENDALDKEFYEGQLEWQKTHPFHKYDVRSDQYNQFH